MINFNKEKLGALCLIGAGIFLSFGGTLIKYMETATPIEIIGINGASLVFFC